MKKAVRDLTPNPKNPRKITDSKLEQLRASLKEFGDLSGIVFNTKSGNLVGGHQRSRVLDEADEVVLVKKYSKPTKTGTTAEGYVLHGNERFSYREVSWSLAKERAAAIAANNNAGVWDLPELTIQMQELAAFDSGIDVDLTMFDESERERFTTVKEHTRKLGGDGDGDEETEGEEATGPKHECPRCGYGFNA